MDYHNSRSVGNYVLGPRIGCGSFAVVWRAHHRFSSREVAVKEIDKSLLTPKLTDNIRKEISILSTIDHPNIIRLLQSIETEDKIYLVLEYCDGGDLAAYIRLHGKVSEVVARHFMREIASGLQVLQEKNFIHRDLKPQNLLLSSHETSPRLKIGDFGFARSLMPPDIADTLCGSPLYMAPEIIRNHKYDAKADLWSVGVILFQLVTGRVPFHGNTQLQLFQNILASTELQFPEGALEELHPDCLCLCRSLLRQNPVERISFTEFFNHNFLKDPRLAVDVDRQLDSSASQKSQSHSECLAEGKLKLASASAPDIVEHGNVHDSSSEQCEVSDSLESIVKDYVFVSRHFDIIDDFSYYPDTSLHENSAVGVPVHLQNKNNQDVAVTTQKEQHASSNVAENHVICRPDPLPTTHAPIIQGELQGETTLHPSARLHLLHQYVQAVGEVALEKYNAGHYLESLSVELVVLAVWKKILQICGSRLASTAGDSSRTSTTEPPHPLIGNTDQVTIEEPSSVCKWAEQEFVAAYNHVEKLSYKVQETDAAAEMPDAMEIIFRTALNLGTSGAVDEFKENKDNAATFYSKAILLFKFVLKEASSIPLNPPFVLTDANKKRIGSYIISLQSHQSRFN